jgi:hypothetical protein
MSGGNFARTAGFAVPQTAPERKRSALSGATSPARSITARGSRKLESILDAIMGEVLARLSPIFE